MYCLILLKFGTLVRYGLQRSRVVKVFTCSQIQIVNGAQFGHGYSAVLGQRIARFCWNLVGCCTVDLSWLKLRMTCGWTALSCMMFTASC